MPHITLFETLEWKKTNSPGGERAIVQFENGYAASVLRGGNFYTRDGTYEIAVMRGENVCYDTPITDDVLGYLSHADAEQALNDIKNLPHV